MPNGKSTNGRLNGNHGNDHTALMVAVQQEEPAGAPELFHTATKQAYATIPVDDHHEPSLPIIRVNDRDLHAVANDAQRAVENAYASTLFLRSGTLVHLAQDEHGRPFIAPLSEAALRDRMSQSARFVKIYLKGGVFESVAVSPPKETAHCEYRNAHSHTY